MAESVTATAPSEVSSPAPAPSAVESDEEPSLHVRYVAAGYALLSSHLQRLDSVAVHYPAVRALQPVLAAALRSLFAHLTLSPDAFAAQEKALAAEATARVVEAQAHRGA